MLPVEVIERKRDGAALASQELCAFLDAYLRGDVADYQMSAFLMAVFYRGLSTGELTALTGAIIGSGRRLDFADGGPPAVDKHSTGGVGDKVSLVLAPLLAEAGLRVPMMSGRGLGHTGGTLDKLESIPGFRTDLSLEEFAAVLGDVGCAMIGQTPEIAPLDGRLYALRDVTGTVPSIPLIAASIVSKKVAEGISALVLDVKFGRGAFLPDREDAVRLARVLVDLAGEFGLPARAVLTAMDAPLGRTVGNALEVRESLDCLRGEGPSDLREVTLALAGEAMAAAGHAGSATEAEAELAALLDSGRALERFGRLVARQGGDPRIVDDPDRLPAAPVRLDVEAPAAGLLAGLDARTVGWAAVELGAGRARAEDAVDPSVGFEILVRPGSAVAQGEPVVRIHAADDAAARRAAARVGAALKIDPAGEPAAPGAPLVWRRLGTESGDASGGSARVEEI
ncbi:MAG: thymidine phosphorylase [Gemmatimonadota bacterium]|nr:thymidine phosphorylase [Gemmatimonadota bacterium]